VPTASVVIVIIIIINILTGNKVSHNLYIGLPQMCAQSDELAVLCDRPDDDRYYRPKCISFSVFSCEPGRRLKHYMRCGSMAHKPIQTLPIAAMRLLWLSLCASLRRAVIPSLDESRDEW